MVVMGSGSGLLQISISSYTYISPPDTHSHSNEAATPNFYFSVSMT